MVTFKNSHTAKQNNFGKIFKNNFGNFGKNFAQFKITNKSLVYKYLFITYLLKRNTLQTAADSVRPRRRRECKLFTRIWFLGDIWIGTFQRQSESDRIDSAIWIIIMWQTIFFWQITYITKLMQNTNGSIIKLKWIIRLLMWQSNYTAKLETHIHLIEAKHKSHRAAKSQSANPNPWAVFPKFPKLGWRMHAAQNT